MRPRSILFGLAVALAPPAFAQNNGGGGGDNNDDNNNNNNDDATTTDDGGDAQTTSTADDSPSSTTDAAETTPTLPDVDQTSTTDSSTSSAASSTTGSVPPITTDNGDTPALPTLPGSYSYPPPAVPPTKNAPFMQQSSLPQGTVFIAVGAILGAFAVAILVWRAVVACLLHRSVKRATLAQQVANDKNSYPPPSAPFYKYSDQASSVSLGNTPATRAGTRKSRGPIPSSTPSQSNLFFSPTAPSGAGGAANRESRFLPSGFYASGAGSPQQGHGHSISLTNLRPDSHGHARPVDPSPPESPSLVPPQEMGRRNPSSSSVNLNRPPSGRAPSAFLEDLLADQPEQFPPAGHRNTWNQPPNRF